MKNINLALLILSMGSASQDGERAPKEVTVVVSRKIKHGCEKDYDEWLRRLLILARKRPGYVGATTIMDDGTDSTVRHIIYRFSDRASVDAWENSEQFRKLIEEVNNYSNRYSQKATGLETWFTLPALKAIVAPPKWKMTIVAFIGSYCISSLAQYILSFFLG
jgi:antibiotic biosynthesis monooxygenase (ABM) superfamily enzyme